MEHSYSETILSVQNVSLAIEGNQILRDVNVSVRNVHRPGVEQGQVIAFLGPSGSGKTQLSKILAGLQPPSSGTVLINTPPVPVKAGMVGYVTQNYFLRRNRTAVGNLILGATQAGMPYKEAVEKADYYLNEFDLIKHKTKYPNQLSGGQRQRVAIAQQLLCSEHYIIMDEPFASLDPLMKEKAAELIIKVSLRDELNTLIIVSHNIRDVLKVSDTVWALGWDRDDKGEVIPGSYIKRTYDLVAEDLCWDPAIFRTQRFNDFVMHVESEFRTL